MKTATLVLGILGLVAAMLGVLAAKLAIAVALQATYGLFGLGFNDGGVGALGAFVGAVIGLTQVGRAPRIAAALLLLSAVIGGISTLAFAPGSVLLVISAITAWFIRSQGPVLAAAAASAPFPAVAQQVSPSLSAPSSSNFSSLLSGSVQVGGRGVPLVAIAGLMVVALIVVAIAGARVASAKDERDPVARLFTAMTAVDDLTISTLIAPAARVNAVGADARRAVCAALGSSEISLLCDGWDAKGVVGGLVGVAPSFQGMAYETVSKDGDHATVRASGTFKPAGPDNLFGQAASALLAHSFRTDVPVVRVDGNWYVETKAVVGGPGTAPVAVGTTQLASQPRPAATQVSTAAPAPTSSPPPTRSPAPTLPVRPVFVPSWSANFADPAGSGLPAAGRGFGTTASYRGGVALLNADNYCSEFLEGSAAGLFINKTPCYWGVQRQPPFTAWRATGLVDDPNVWWGVVFRAGGVNDWTTSKVTSAVSVSIRPADGSFAVGSLDNRNGKYIAQGKSPAIQSKGENEISVEVEGPSLVVSVNGFEIARALDSQVGQASGFGVSTTGTIAISRMQGR